jgi:hypothetical protein
MRVIKIDHAHAILEKGLIFKKRAEIYRVYDKSWKYVSTGSWVLLEVEEAVHKAYGEYEKPKPYVPSRDPWERVKKGTLPPARIHLTSDKK